MYESTISVYWQMEIFLRGVLYFKLKRATEQTIHWLQLQSRDLKLYRGKDFVRGIYTEPLSTKSDAKMFKCEIKFNPLD